MVGGIPHSSANVGGSGEDHDQDPEVPREVASDTQGDVVSEENMRLSREAAALAVAREKEEKEKRQKEREEEERDLTPEEEARLIAHWERRRVLYERVSALLCLPILSSAPPLHY